MKINSKLSYVCKMCMQTVHVDTLVIESHYFLKDLGDLGKCILLYFRKCLEIVRVLQFYFD